MNYTSIEQSRKLLELGLSPESADMYYDKDIQAFPFITPYQNGKYPPCYWKQYPNLRSRIPCWSVGALLNIMPKLHKLQHSENGYYCSLANYKYVTEAYNNSIDACYNMVIWLLENNYIKKGE